MNKSAILHIPMSQYAYGYDEEHVIIRLRAAKNDLDKCTLYFGDRSCRVTPVIFTKEEMTLEASSELYDYFQATLVNPYKRLNYYFELESNGEKILYYGDNFEEANVDDRSEYFQLPFNHRADIASPPEWTKSAIFYNIFPDSFASGKRSISEKGIEVSYENQIAKSKLGGTINGIKDNVDYFKELGINAIYINPIFAAGEYHKYDLLDYYHIDPCFGTDDDFRELVQVFHKNDIKVVIDGVFNHCGWKCFLFEDIIANQENSHYVNWFYGLKFPVERPDSPEIYPTYDCFGYERMMPKLDLSNPETREYFCNVGKYWIEKYNIDGWRLDVASEINDGFWRAFRTAVKSVKQDAILIGEVWESAGHWLDGTMFDSTMNYDFRKHCKRFFAKESIDSANFNSRVTDMLMRYRKQMTFSQLNVLDTHDVSRFLSECDENIERYKLALVFQMCFVGMPCIFYGDECGIKGILEEEYRKPMPWGEPESDLFDFIKTLIAIRTKIQALSTGEYKVVSAEASSRVYAFERFDAKDRVIIVLNAGDTSTKIPLDMDKAEILFAEKYYGGIIEGKGFVIAKC